MASFIFSGDLDYIMTFAKLLWVVFLSYLRIENQFQFIYLFIPLSNRHPLPYHSISRTRNNIAIKFLMHTQQ